MSPRENLDPKVLAHIHKQGFDEEQGGVRGQWYRCGCDCHGGHWWLCAYHEGYADGIEAQP